MDSESRKEYFLKATLLHQLDTEYEQLKFTKSGYQQELKDSKRDMKTTIVSVLIASTITIGAVLLAGVPSAATVVVCLVVHTTAVIVTQIHEHHRIEKTIHNSMDRIDQRIEENRQEYQRIAAL